jgi:hypothetical protein
VCSSDLVAPPDGITRRLTGLYAALKDEEAAAYVARAGAI